MTPQDTQALQGFLTQLAQARVGAKDPQADALIAEAVARQPDAAYLLVQRAILLDQALAAAKMQISSLQNQLQAAQSGQANGAHGFMDADTWGNSANRAAPATVMPAPVQASAPSQVTAQAPMAPTAYQAAPAQPARSGFLGGGLGGALGSIATTAAGVAGGAFLFQGIENLFHHNSGGGNGWNGGNPLMGQSDPGTQPGETVVNNYYGNDRNDDRSSVDTNGSADSGFLDAGLDDSDFLDDDSSLV